MKLSEETKKAIIREVCQHLQYPEDVDVSEQTTTITALVVTIKDQVLIEIEDASMSE